MLRIERYYTCDCCKNTHTSNNDIFRVKVSHPEIYDEGEIDEDTIEFDVCRHCATRDTLEQLINTIRPEISPDVSKLIDKAIANSNKITRAGGV